MKRRKPIVDGRVIRRVRERRQDAALRMLRLQRMQLELDMERVKADIVDRWYRMAHEEGLA